MIHFTYATKGSSYKIGKKINARILYHYSSSSRQKFSLALTEHVLNLGVRHLGHIPCRYIIANRKSFILKFLRIDLESGLLVDVELGLEGTFAFFFSSHRQ